MEKPIGLQDCVLPSALSLHFLRTASLSWIMPLRWVCEGSLLQQLGLASEVQQKSC